MDVILLERIQKLGQMGDIVRVKDGYARNFLLPSGKALRATDANKKRFEVERVQLEARNLELRTEAGAVGEKLDGQSFIAIRQAGETGQLYGSVSTRDIADLIEAGGFSVARSQVRLDRPIKEIGLHDVTVSLHPEVEVSVIVNVARSADEAERQARGEDVTLDRFDMDDDDDDVEVGENDEASTEEFFDEDAAPEGDAGEDVGDDAGEEADESESV